MNLICRCFVIFIFVTVLPTFSVSSQEIEAGAGGEISFIRFRGFQSRKEYTRIVIDSDKPVQYKKKRVNLFPSDTASCRIFVDIEQSRLRRTVPAVINIRDSIVGDVRAIQLTPDMVRIVIDIHDIGFSKVFFLKKPTRMIIDIWKDSA